MMLSSIIKVHDVEGLAVNRKKQQHRHHRHRQQQQESHTANHGNRNNSNSNNNKQLVSMLSKALRIMYDQGGTTAVLNGCQETLLQYKASVLVKAALMAGNGDIANTRNSSNNNKGVSSGILNALLGCCCCCADDGYNANDSSGGASNYRNMAIELMKAYDDIGQKQYGYSFEPDLVSLCLTYVATTAANENKGVTTDENDPVAENFLRRAEQFYNTSSLVSPSKDDKIESKPSTAKTGKDDDLSPTWLELEQFYDIKVLEDSEEFVVLSKPSGMVCYHGENSPFPTGDGAKRKQQRRRRRNKQRNINDDDDDKSLEECLLDYGLPLSSLNKEGRGLVHRIDRGTSGCLVVAKTNRMHAILLTQFFLRRSKKSYQALVCGSNFQQQAIHAQKINGNDNIISLDIDGRPAKSRYAFEKRIGKYLTRLRVETEQGRRHQVRIHCSKGLKAPILLDPLYGGQSILSTFLKNHDRCREGRDGEKYNSYTETNSSSSSSSTLLRQARVDQKFCLHASSLKIDKVGIDVQAQLPEWWQQLEEELQ